MDGEREEPMWRARLRWRLRGAWQWPVFLTLTVFEAVLLNRLPISGDGGLDLIGGFLLCGFFNLAVVACLAPLGARALRRLRAMPVPLEVVQDRMATGLMALLAVVLVGIGALHHTSVVAAHDDYDAQLAAARRYLAHQAPPQYARNIGHERVWKQAPGLYRTCVPGPDPDRDLCLIVKTDQGVPTVRRD